MALAWTSGELVDDVILHTQVISISTAINVISPFAMLEQNCLPNRIFYKCTERLLNFHWRLFLKFLLLSFDDIFYRVEIGLANYIWM